MLVSGDAILVQTLAGRYALINGGTSTSLLPLGAAAEDLESLGMGKDIGQVTVLLLADTGYVPLNPQSGSVTLPRS